MIKKIPQKNKQIKLFFCKIVTFCKWCFLMLNRSQGVKVCPNICEINEVDREKKLGWVMLQKLDGKITQKQVEWNQPWPMTRYFTHDSNYLNILDVFDVMHVQTHTCTHTHMYAHTHVHTHISYLDNYDWNFAIYGYLMLLTLCDFVL